jgi:hypothetical protein
MFWLALSERILPLPVQAKHEPQVLPQSPRRIDYLL